MSGYRIANVATSEDLAALGMAPVAVTADEFRLLQDEASFQRQIMELAELCGWAVWHDADSRRNAAGFPDLVLVRGEQLIFAELKTVKGRVSRAQERWLALFGSVPGVQAHVWRPTDWKEIEQILGGAA